MSLPQRSPAPSITQSSQQLSRLIIGFVVLVIVGSLAAAAYNIAADFQDKFDTGEQNAKNLALLLDEHARRSVEAVDVILRDVVRAFTAPPVGQISEGDIAEVLRDHVPSPLIGALFIIGPDGRVISDAEPEPMASLPDINFLDREYFGAHRGAEIGLRISAPIVSRTTGKPFIPFSRAARSADGTLLGIVVAAVRPEAFRDTYSQINIGRQGFLSVALTNGELLARNPYVQNLIGISLADTPLFQERLRNSASGTYVAVSTLDGVERVFAYRRVEGLPLVVIAGLATAELYEQVRSENLKEFTGTVLFLVLLCAFAVLVIRQLRQLDRLTDAVTAGENRFRVLFADNPLPMWVFDLKTLYFLEVNKAAMKAYGYSRDEFLRLTIRDIRPPEDVPDFMKAFARRRADELRISEGRHRLKSGAIIDVHISSHDIAFDEREAVLVAAIDISARKAAEAMLRQSQKMDAVGQLTGGVAHDFNNRLAAILGNLELLDTRLRDDPENRALVTSALRSTLRGAELTQHLLAFSRMQPLQPKPVNIGALLAQTHELLRRTLSESIVIAIDPDEGLRKAMVDPAQLENALLNLALNARDAMPHGGKLRIEASNASLDPSTIMAGVAPTTGPYVRLAVTDTGHGMSPETLDRALDPFFTTKEIGKGTGLGLSMVYGFVKQSGGHLRIRSAPGQGTAVELFLPMAPDDQGAIEPPPLEPPGAGGGETILVVDDDPEVRRAVEKMLRDLAYTVHTAEDGRSGLAVLQQHPEIHMMISDVGLPGGMRGPALVQLARQARPDLSFLYISGYARPSVEQSGALGEGVELISKPFRKAAFAKKVREILDRRT